MKDRLRGGWEKGGQHTAHPSPQTPPQPPRGSAAAHRPRLALSPQAQNGGGTQRLVPARWQRGRNLRGAELAGAGSSFRAGPAAMAEGSAELELFRRRWREELAAGGKKRRREAAEEPGRTGRDGSGCLALACGLLDGESPAPSSPPPARPREEAARDEADDLLGQLIRDLVGRAAGRGLSCCVEGPGGAIRTCAISGCACPVALRLDFPSCRAALWRFALRISFSFLLLTEAPPA